MHHLARPLTRTTFVLVRRLALQVLSTIALSQPHAAFAAFCHRLSSKWTFLSRTTDGLEQNLQLLEDILRKGLLQSISGRSVSDVERDLVDLPARLG